MTNGFRLSRVRDDEATRPSAPARPAPRPGPVGPQPGVVLVGRIVLAAHATWWGFGAVAGVLWLVVVDPPATDGVDAGGRSVVEVLLYAAVALLAAVLAARLGPRRPWPWAAAVALNLGLVVPYLVQFAGRIGDPPPDGLTGGWAAVLAPLLAAGGVAGAVALLLPAARRFCRGPGPG